VRVWSQVVGFVLLRLAGIWLESPLRFFFSHLMRFRKKFYNFFTFSAICKDNAAVNCITVQHK
jgi:hypothetical protein